MEDVNLSIEEKNNWMNRVLNEYCGKSVELQQIVNVLHERDNDNAKADMERYEAKRLHRVRAEAEAQLTQCQYAMLLRRESASVGLSAVSAAPK